MLGRIVYLSQKRSRINSLIEDEHYYAQVGEIADYHVKKLQLQKAREDALRAIKKGEKIKGFSKAIGPALERIINDTKLLNTPDLSDEDRQRLSAQVVQSTDALTVGIEKVLYMARIDSDSIVYNAQDTLVGEIVKGLYNEFKDEDGSFHSVVGFEAPLQFHLSEGSPDILVHCDSFHLHNALAEILKNSIRFSKRGDIQIGWYHHLADHEVQIFIEDTGVGIAEENIDKVFDPFYKENPDTPCAGVGLTIAKSIVEKFDGRIVIESRKNYSTRCCVILPTV